MELNKDDRYRNYACFNLLKDLLNNSEEFKKIFTEGINNGTIRLFTDDIWQKIEKQNFIPPAEGIDDFVDFFKQGRNIGSCVWTSWQLSYSFNDVSIVSGTLPILKGTFNAPKEGGHRWLENNSYIIDTSLMLIIDKSIKSLMGYNEEGRLTQYDLNRNPRYQERKYFTNDSFIKKSSR